MFQKSALSLSGLIVASVSDGTAADNKAIVRKVTANNDRQDAFPQGAHAL